MLIVFACAEVPLHSLQIKVHSPGTMKIEAYVAYVASSIPKASYPE